MTAGTVSQDVTAYLGEVRACLDDLPAEERDDLLADVEASILESAAESDAPVETRLGPPHAFADELRAAAGLPPRADAVRDPSRPSLRERLAAARVFFTTSPRSAWLRELAPLWWVLRALVAVGVIEMLYGESVFRGDAAPDGYALVVALGALLAVVLSVAAGLRHRRRNRAVVLVNLVLALAAPVVIWHALGAGKDAAFNDGVAIDGLGPPAPWGLVQDGMRIENVYAFDRRGRPLQDVRLFDQDGRPLEIREGRRDPNRRLVRTRSGSIALNAFPIRYFEPGTRRVEDPAAGRPPRPGPVRTRPLGEP